MITMDLFKPEVKKIQYSHILSESGEKVHQMSCFSGPKVVLLRNWRCGSHIFLESGEHKLSHSSISKFKRQSLTGYSWNHDIKYDQIQDHVLGKTFQIIWP
jgi:hypothetical protein